MVMSSDDIIHHMACDLSQWITQLVPSWEYASEPADAYADTICALFGDDPTEASVIAAYKFGDAVTAMQRDLNTRWTTDLINEQRDPIGIESSEPRKRGNKTGLARFRALNASTRISKALTRKVFFHASIRALTALRMRCGERRKISVSFPILFASKY